MSNHPKVTGDEESFVGMDEGRELADTPNIMLQARVYRLAAANAELQHKIAELSWQLDAQKWCEQDAESARQANKELQKQLDSLVFQLNQHAGDLAKSRLETQLAMCTLSEAVSLLGQIAADPDLPAAASRSIDSVLHKISTAVATIARDEVVL
jgi:hypothetical protein